MTPQEIRDHIGDLDEDILIADGFDDALVGYVQVAGKPLVALYDRDLCIAILVKRDGMTPEEAEEYFQFNVEGAYVGEYSPAFGTFLGVEG